MNKKEEEIIKRTFYYQHNRRAKACQNLKDIVMKELSVIFSPICVFIKGIQTAITQEREYNQVLKSLSSSPSSTSNVNIRHNPEIISIHQTTHFTYKEAEDIYNLSKKYNIPIDTLTGYLISSGLGVCEIERAIEEKVNKK